MDIKEVAAYHRKRAQQVHEAGIVNASGNHVAMAEACERFTWRPIETAPMDGTWILLRGGHDGGPDCVAAHWVEAEGSAWKEWVMAWFDGGYPISYTDPTHWMPLPDAPQL